MLTPPCAAAGCVFAFALCAAVASAVDRLSVTTLQPLLVIAIDRGAAHGVLVGEAASLIAATFQSTSPIEIDVTRVRSLGAGCARLNVTTRQDQVVDFNREARDASPGRKAFSYQVNFCRDGGMPRSDGRPR